MILLIGLFLCHCSAENRGAIASASDNYADLLSLFREFREFQDQEESAESLVDIGAAMVKMYEDLENFQSRLEAAIQIDF
jgi:hypothetical protein